MSNLIASEYQGFEQIKRTVAEKVDVRRIN
jgi:hypothetical protein